jgi:arylsulfatase A-like enzyme
MFALIILFLCVLLHLQTASPAPQYPHIFFVLTDDAGFGVWPSQGVIKTPALDELAKESFVLNEFYAWQFCSPSRGAFLTGRYPWRLPNSRINLIPSYVLDGTPLGYNMLPRRLASRNFLSYHSGKWHQGLAWNEFTPLARGFNYTDAFLSGGEDHFTQVADLSVGDCNSPGSSIRDAWFMNSTSLGAIGEYTGTRFSQRAVEYVEQHAQNFPDKSMFLYLALHNTHGPLEALPEYIKMYNSTYPFPQQHSYYAMMSTVDDTVANLTAAIKKAGLWDNSIFIFTTDNGAPVQVGGTNYPLRGGKGSNWNGGFQVPFMISGGALPVSQRGKVAPLGNPLSITDMYATILSIAGINDASDPGGPAAIDSLNAWPFLSGQVPSSPRADVPLVIDHNMYTDQDKAFGAIRLKNYKLLIGSIEGEMQSSWYGHFSPNASVPMPSLNYTACSHGIPPYGCLFDVVADPSEHNDLATQLPDVMNQMLELFYSYNSSYHPPKNNPPSDEKGLCQAALANDRIVTPWRTDPPPEYLY